MFDVSSKTCISGNLIVLVDSFFPADCIYVMIFCMSPSTKCLVYDLVAS